MSLSAWLVSTKFAGGRGKALKDLGFLKLIVQMDEWEVGKVFVSLFTLSCSRGKVPYYASRGPGFLTCFAPIASCSRQQMPRNGEPTVGERLFLPHPVSVSTSWSLSSPSHPINLFFHTGNYHNNNRIKWWRGENAIASLTMYSIGPGPLSRNCWEILGAPL